MRHSDKAAERRSDEITPSRRPSLALSPICPACGAESARESAQFCRVCGKILSEDYEPLDALRASYRLQGKSFRFEKAQLEIASRGETLNLFEENKNSAADAARAFVVYSLVPYLGIFFCLGAFLTGGVGIFISFRKPCLGGRKTAVYSIILSIIILTIQILLWWLLYIIPELGKGF